MLKVLQFIVAVVAGVAVGSGLLLAFTLKEDKFDAKFPLIKRSPDTSKQEYYPQLELKYNESLILNHANELSVNTSGFYVHILGIYHWHLHPWKYYIKFYTLCSCYSIITTNYMFFIIKC